jgi:hypothetical protein
VSQEELDLQALVDSQVIKDSKDHKDRLEVMASLELQARQDRLDHQGKLDHLVPLVNREKKEPLVSLEAMDNRATQEVLAKEESQAFEVHWGLQGHQVLKVSLGLEVLKEQPENQEMLAHQAQMDSQVVRELPENEDLQANLDSKVNQVQQDQWAKLGRKVVMALLERRVLRALLDSLDQLVNLDHKVFLDYPDLLDPLEPLDL